MNHHGGEREARPDGKETEAHITFCFTCFTLNSVFSFQFTKGLLLGNGNNGNGEASERTSNIVFDV